jgi:MFS family permease
MQTSSAAKAPASAPAPEPAHAWVVVWAAFVSLALIFGVAYSFAAFFKSFAAEFNAQRADVSLVFGLTGLIYFGFGALGGMLSDRFGPRLVCGAGMVCIALGLLAASLSTTLLAVYLSYGVAIGFGIALVYTPAIGSVLPWFTQRRGLAAGIASAGIGLGTVLVPLLATAAISTLDWRMALRLMSAGVLVAGLVSTGLLKRAPVARPEGAKPEPASTNTSAAVAASITPGGATLRQALQDKRFWWFYLFTFTSAPTMFIPFAHVSASARDIGVHDASAVGLVGLIGIGSLIGRFAIGALADRLGRLQTLTLAQVSMGGTYLLWMVAGGYPALAIFALWFGLSYGGIVSLMPAICMDMFGARAVSSIVGALYTAAALGNLLGPVVAGAVFDHTASYAPVMWGCLALSLLATAAAARIIRTRGAVF